MGATVKWKKLAESTRVEAGSAVRLADFAADARPRGMDKKDGLKQLEAGKLELFDLQDKLYAQGDRSVLIVLQAIDAAGKDGTIKHVMSGINPEGVDVHSFKQPSAEEREHGYLWRHQKAVPPLGRIGIFNRSHYENVLVTRVHPELLWPKTSALPTEGIWKQRYKDINAWEKYLTDNGTVVVKLFLNVSPDEQARRFLARIDTETKNWKFSKTDMAERDLWPDYQRAFGDMLSHTSTPHAPWHVIPADHKWAGHLATFAVLLEAIKRIDPQYPAVSAAERADLSTYRQRLIAQLSD
ncbi:putative polyphosphate kinase [Gordonia hirsuta DSM 44140 = NBRC 16056]|uniref:Putative polyphosphate kinase n=1 Tax=Gordonia hirsuta DSM 44140 = NBRC 16056 TaxID=1121927 RepID=L7L775_9ACTN|nr:polyphosphate kinase 2 family protein [Gordonia hirsuta]GAC56970.1 putative polyphosphate kinase [Gordonia hirsuta DSM 44140 = NBRC 16056]